TQGLASAAAVSVTGLNGFSNAVTVSVSNLPPGIAAYLHPASLKSGSTLLTLDAASTAAPGTYLIAVNGTGGLVSHSANVSLTVVAEAAGTAYQWPAYSPNLNYNFTNEYAAIQ